MGQYIFEGLFSYVKYLFEGKDMNFLELCKILPKIKHFWPLVHIIRKFQIISKGYWAQIIQEIKKQLLIILLWLNVTNCISIFDL